MLADYLVEERDQLQKEGVYSDESCDSGDSQIEMEQYF